MEDVAEIKSLIEQQGKAFEAFKAANEEVQAQIKKLGSADAATEAKLAKIDQELHNLAEAAQKRADELEKRMNRPGALTGAQAHAAQEEVKAFNAILKPGIRVDAEGYAAYKQVFGRFMRGLRDHQMGADEHKALAVGSDPDGGYLVPVDTSGRIVQRIYETSPIRAIASAISIGTDALDGTRDTDEAGSGGWVTERAARAATSTPQLGKWRIEVHEMFAAPEATQQLLDDAAVDVEGWLANKVADKLTRLENAAFVTGNGVGKPHGFADYPTAATADASRAWGTLEHVATGSNGAFGASNAADVLLTLIGAFKDAHLNNARWVTRREVITAIRKLKDGQGQYLWQPGLQQGQPQQILGYPVTIAADMPALATGSLSLALGDFREGYLIVDRQGFRTLRDPFTNKPFVQFYTTRRVGGGVLNFEAIKFVKFGS